MSKVQWERLLLKDILGESQRGKRLKKADRVEGEIPLVTAGYINTGVAGFIGTTEGMTLFRNALTIDMFGNCFYREYAFYADDNILVITKEGLNKEHYLYLSTLIGNETKNYDYTKQYRMKDYNKQTLMVPYNKKEECPDWSYMEAYIREKQEQVKLRLDQLTSINETPKTLVYSALNRGVGVSHNIEWAEFTVEELFNKVEFNKTNYKVTTQPKVSDEINKVPAITASGFNKGVGCYVPHKDEITIGKNMITISANGAGTGSTFYQEDEFTILQDSYAIITKDVTLNRYLGLYLASILNKYLTSTYDYGNKSTWNKVKTETISLPSYRVLDEDNKYINKPNWDYMEAYIREKQQQVKLRLEQLTSINETPKTLVYSALNRR